MYTAMQVIEKAIQNDKGIMIFLTNSLNEAPDGYIPIHVKFVSPEEYPFVGETSYHPNLDSELELKADCSLKPQVACLCSNTKTKVKIEGFYESIYLKYDSPIYAFLEPDVETCFEDLENESLDENWDDYMYSEDVEDIAGKILEYQMPTEE